MSYEQETILRSIVIPLIILVVYNVLAMRAPKYEGESSYLSSSTFIGSLAIISFFLGNFILFGLSTAWFMTYVGLGFGAFILVCTFHWDKGHQSEDTISATTFAAVYIVVSIVAAPIIRIPW